MEQSFAARSPDVERVVALVVREASEECEPDACLVHPVLESCAREAVVTLWDSPIKTHVPCWRCAASEHVFVPATARPRSGERA